MNPEDPRGADATPEPRRAEAAFGVPNRRIRWRDIPHLRAVLLVAALVAVKAVLLVGPLKIIGSDHAEPSGGAGTPSGNVFAAGCPGSDAPELALVSGQKLDALRARVSSLVPPRFGRTYQSGAIDSRDVWSDDSPSSSAAPGFSGSKQPDGYEVRWWVRRSNDTEDDVAADVLQFKSAAEATRFKARASDPRCRHAAAAEALPLPSGASILYWVNPDAAPEWDVYLVRGRFVYRVVYVPPEYLVTGGPSERRAIARSRAGLTAVLLACSLPEARCPQGSRTPRGASIA